MHRAKVNEIKIKIASLIDHEYSLKDWLINKGYATAREIRNNLQKMQQTRYNMIDDLIHYYEAKGD